MFYVFLYVITYFTSPKHVLNARLTGCLEKGCVHEVIVYKHLGNRPFFTENFVLNLVGTNIQEEALTAILCQQFGKFTRIQSIRYRTISVACCSSVMENAFNINE